MSMRAFTMMVNRPSVRMYSGIEMNATIGLTMALTSPNTSAMSRMIASVSQLLSPPTIDRPGRISVANQMATPLMSTRTRKAMRRSCHRSRGSVSGALPDSPTPERRGREVTRDPRGPGRRARGGRWHAEPVTRVPLRPALADLPPYVPGARVPVGAAAFKLSSNENPYPPLPSVVLAISDAAEDVNRYPDMYATELVGAIAASLGVAPENIVAGCGSVAVLGHVLTAVCQPDDEVVVPWRSFEAYPIAVDAGRRPGRARAGGRRRAARPRGDGRGDHPADQGRAGVHPEQPDRPRGARRRAGHVPGGGPEGRARRARRGVRRVRPRPAGARRSGRVRGPPERGAAAHVLQGVRPGRSPGRATRSRVLASRRGSGRRPRRSASPTSASSPPSRRCARPPSS